MSSKTLKRIALSLVAGLLLLLAIMQIQSTMLDGSCPNKTDAGLCVTTVNPGDNVGFPLHISGTAAYFAIDIVFFWALAYLAIFSFEKMHIKSKQTRKP